MRTRECVNSQNGGKCSGEDSKYRGCNEDPCPGSAIRHGCPHCQNLADALAHCDQFKKAGQSLTIYKIGAPTKELWT